MAEIPGSNPGEPINYCTITNLKVVFDLIGMKLTRDKEDYRVTVVEVSDNLDEIPEEIYGKSIEAESPETAVESIIEEYQKLHQAGDGEGNETIFYAEVLGEESKEFFRGAGGYDTASDGSYASGPKEKLRETDEKSWDSIIEDLE
jgi:hypothetical protein